MGGEEGEEEECSPEASDPLGRTNDGVRKIGPASGVWGAESRTVFRCIKSG